MPPSNWRIPPKKRGPLTIEDLPQTTTLAHSQVGAFKAMTKTIHPKAPPRRDVQLPNTLPRVAGGVRWVKSTTAWHNNRS